MKRFLALPQVLILLLFLSACGGNGKTDTIPDDSITFSYLNGFDNYLYTTETININNTGSIDLKDYLFPLEGVSILNYEIISFYDGVEGLSQDDSEYFMFNGDYITISSNFGLYSTDYEIQNDRIRIKGFGDGGFFLRRDSALGRFYEVGDLVYTAVTLENDLLLDSNGNPTYQVDKSCQISKTLSSLTTQGYSYTGDIIEFACHQESYRTTTNSLGGEFTNTFNLYEYTYYKKGVGKIAMSTDNCNPNNDFVPSTINSSDCPNQFNIYSTYQFLVE